MSYDMDSPEFKRYLAWEADQIIIEKLKMTLEELQNSYTNSEMNLKLSTYMIKQLKEALKKCSPYGEEYCHFCGKHWALRHTDDCEYVRLTGGAE